MINVNNLASTKYWMTKFMTCSLGIEQFITNFLVLYTLFSPHYWRGRVDR